MERLMGGRRSWDKEYDGENDGDWWESSKKVCVMQGGDLRWTNEAVIALQ